VSRRKAAEYVRLKLELAAARAERDDHQEQRAAMAGAYDLMGTRMSLAEEKLRNQENVLEALRQTIADAADLFENRVVEDRHPEEIDAWLARPEVIEARKK